MPSRALQAPVTGQSYGEMLYAQDRWTEYWIGGTVSVIAPPPGQGANPPLPENVHLHQYPTPGVRLDQWDYDSLKKIALRWGTYYRLDRAGLLHPQGASDSDQGITPADVLESQVIGDHRGLVFIDTIDGQPPRVDNMGTLVLETDYVEGLSGRARSCGAAGLVRRGNLFRLSAHLHPGQQSLGARVPVQLSGIHVNGLLYAAGTIRARTIRSRIRGDHGRSERDVDRSRYWYRSLVQRRFGAGTLSGASGCVSGTGNLVGEVLTGNDKNERQCA